MYLFSILGKGICSAEMKSPAHSPHQPPSPPPTQSDVLKEYSQPQVTACYTNPSHAVLAHHAQSQPSVTQGLSLIPDTNSPSRHLFMAKALPLYHPWNHYFFYSIWNQVTISNAFCGLLKMSPNSGPLLLQTALSLL